MDIHLGYPVSGEKMSSVAERLQLFNQARDPQLLQMKYKAMRENPFALLRERDLLITIFCWI